MSKWNITDPSLSERIEKLEQLVEHLIEENIGTTNALYEIENKLDMLSACQYNMLDTQSKNHV